MRGPNGSLTHLAKDRNAQLPFWQEGNALSDKARASAPKPFPSFNRRYVAGEGERGRTGPPTYLRGGGKGQTSALDESARLQQSRAEVTDAFPSLFFYAETTDGTGIFVSARTVFVTRTVTHER